MCNSDSEDEEEEKQWPYRMECGNLVILTCRLPLICLRVFNVPLGIEKHLLDSFRFL